MITKTHLFSRRKFERCFWTMLFLMPRIKRIFKLFRQYYWPHYNTFDNWNNLSWATTMGEQKKKEAKQPENCLATSVRRSIGFHCKSTFNNIGSCWNFTDSPKWPIYKPISIHLFVVCFSSIALATIDEFLSIFVRWASQLHVSSWKKTFKSTIFLLATKPIN